MNALANVIYREINDAGPMPFARFMELALYCPELGFYERFPHRIGKSGDFYTSVSVGPLFGRLLAFRFSHWLRQLGPSGERCQVLEAGAHDGQLSLDILTWLKEHAASVFHNLCYCILEPSARRESWQRVKLGDLAREVRWIRDWSEFPPGSLRGIIFSNELLDAFPVYRFGWDARNREWFEYGVGLRGGRLVWSRLPCGTSEGTTPVLVAPEMVPASVSDGFVVESAPGARRWWRRAASALGRGWLVTIDYGFAGDLPLDPARPEGTLRAYRKHLRVPDLLADPGEQDLTAHVDFSALCEAGEAEGVRTEGLMSQGRFLARVLEQIVQARAPGFDWSRAERRQFQTLTHPEHLGERYKVLVQARGNPVEGGADFRDE